MVGWAFLFLNLQLFDKRSSGCKCAYWVGRPDLLTSLGDIKGSLVRIGPNTVITTDFRHAQRMEALKSPYRKGPWYGTFRFQKGKDHSFCMVDEEKHAALRTKIGPGYSASNLVVRRKQLLKSPLTPDS